MPKAKQKSKRTTVDQAGSSRPRRTATATAPPSQPGSEPLVQASQPNAGVEQRGPGPSASEYDSWPLVCAGNETLNLNVGPEQAQQGGLMINDPPVLATPREALGSAVPRALRDRIWKGEFVDLGALLKNVPVPDGSAPMVIALSGSTLQVQPQRGVPRITSIEQWTSAFLVFASIYTEKHVVRALEMYKYMDTVRTAARFGGNGWHTYDLQFRLRQAREPTRSWAVIDSELWLMTATAPCTQSTPAYYGNAFREGSPYGQTNQWEGNAGRRQTTGRPFGRESRGLRYCFNFNSGRCVKQDCVYAHRCQQCGQTSHGRSQCTLGKRTL
eukprot:XP_011661770.1 PREDICTED: uncharacterized protein LOC105437170 [Strongylocentrotus purpuratus]